MLKIGVAQIRNRIDVKDNFLTILKCLKAFEFNKPDVILFPECALSGFSSKIKDSTLEVLKPYLDKVGDWTRKNKVTVFLPTALKSGDAIYNTGFCFKNGEVDQFFKLGLTETEKKFFSIPKHPTSKVFKVNGFRIGLLICYEAEMNPYEYFDKGSVDLMLWPGYWGWDKEDNWSSNKKNGEENKIFKNMSEWKVPLIQSNFSFNDLNDYRATGPHGLSMFVNSDNQLIGQGGFEEEGCYLMVLNKLKGIQSIESLFI